MRDPPVPLILASGSSARRQLLHAAGLPFAVVPAAIDEAEIKASAQSGGISPEDTAILLADMKARRVALTRPEALVIGADQLLVCDGRWFDKPADMADARAHLSALRGREHVLVTAVVCHRGLEPARVWQHVARPRLRMRAFSDEFLDRYLAMEGEAVLGSVGAYRLEAMGIHLFAAIEGEQGAILGLPMLPLLDFLRGHGLVAS